MTLDLGQVALRLPLLIGRVQHEADTRSGRRERALDLLHVAARDPEAFEATVRNAQTSWPLALPFVGRIDAHVPPPAPPDAATVLAVDGSSIDVDRNLPLDCFVLNLGWMQVRYGAQHGSDCGSTIDLQPTDENVYLRDDDDPSHEAAIRGNVLDLLRSVRELDRLSHLAVERATPGAPLLALVDGNLALWNLEKRDLPQAVTDDLKYGERGARQALDRLRTLVDAGSVVFSGFVSRTGAGNLASSLRLLACPNNPHVACRQCPGKGSGSRPCDEAAVAGDAELMAGLLGRWERSAVFLPHRAGNTAERWYAESGHEIAFFYLRTDDEIARIETPTWVAENPARLDVLHALLVQQAQEGNGYPLALQEAHEQAVISTQDRRAFTTLLADACERQGVPWLVSAKAWSKTVRAI